MSSIGRNPGAGYRAATAGPFSTTGSSPASTRGRTATDTARGWRSNASARRTSEYSASGRCASAWASATRARPRARQSRAAIRCSWAAAAAHRRSASVSRARWTTAGSGERRHASQSKRAVARRRRHSQAACTDRSYGRRRPARSCTWIGNGPSHPELAVAGNER